MTPGRRGMLKYVIAVSGWVMLGLYLYYDYQVYGSVLFEHLFSSGSPAGNIFHALMLLAPAMSMYIAYLLHQRERLSRELLTKEKIESLSEMTGGIARDFQSLLSAVSGHIAEAKRTSDLPGEVLGKIGEVEGEVAAAREHIRELIAFSKGLKPETQVTIVEEAVKQVCEAETLGTGLSCQYDIPEDLWPGSIDRAMLREALAGVVRHAVKNSPPSGTVFVSCRNLSVGMHGTLPLTKGDYVQVAVRDEGGGLEEERLRRLFDPYAQGGEMGLGLATVFSIIQQNGGYVSAVSDEGRGTSLLLYVPVPAFKEPGRGIFAP
jgi:signal transduction histidine kinase